MTPIVYIVILNWNRYDDTLECLRSVARLDSQNTRIKVIVVDNASNDDSASRLREYITKTKNHHLIINKSNLGFAEGNNVGLRFALTKDADFVMVLNNDTIVDKKLLSEFIKHADLYPKAGVLSPKIYFARGFEFHKKRYKKEHLGKVIWYAGGEIDWENVYSSNRGVDEVDSGQYDNPQEIDFATGACMFLRAKALQSDFLFNSQYFMYSEDVDLSLRIKKDGWEVWYIPSAVLWHKVAQSSGIGSGLNDYFSTRNRMMFGMSYATLRAKVALVRESYRLILHGRKWQRLGILDFYLGRFGKGSWK